MPELPEVETIRRGLENLRGKKIKNFFRSQKRLRIESTLDFSTILNSKIKNFDRKARYLIINFDNSCSLVVHLGMSGRLVISDEKAYSIKKHDHFICHFDDATSLIFNDPRRFGFIDLVKTKDLQKHKMLARLACEPLSQEFNSDYLASKLRDKKMNIKTTMMDNKIVVGVGNIYINESLFAAKISPLRSANSLTKNEIEKLTKAIKKILEDAIELGGSSISDYVNSSGSKGNFQNNFKVYANNNKKCLHCKNIITKIVQNGRSSFFCKKCQK